ncbi:hypothetical protein EW146_g7706 [Bondarzewia mesenterica]|uniref:Nucleotide exchange factor Fes1 domain-containing protein n=1 Tax=Bondarzewia mesenterica TaxID=1095465 RepID=A0A4S4LLX0_9AGAM|nr:hypothetical protein EW146_g7706 [Bondarzewia mesenterica]
MESLLRWSIEHSGNQSGDNPSSAPAPRKDLDPAILDQILGRPDAELMKEALAKASDEERSEDERVAALDDLEMLVENIDNANDLEKLKMWDAIQNLLMAPSSTSEIKTQVLWVIGTAVQNNPSAQNAYLSLNHLSTILSFLSPSVKSSQLRSKAVYTLSGLLKHNATAVSQFGDAGGWEVLCTALEDSDITVRRKTAFLLNTLLIPSSPPSASCPPLPLAIDAPPASTLASASASSSNTSSNSATLHTSDAPDAPVHPNSHASMLSDPTLTATGLPTFRALREHGLLPVLIRAFTSPTPHGADGESEGDVDFEEKVARLLHTYVTSPQGEFFPDEKEALRQFFSIKVGADVGGGMFGLEENELRTLMRSVE